MKDAPQILPGTTDRTLHQDLRLISRSLKQRWPIPRKRRAELITQMMEIVFSDQSGANEKVQAMRCILMADKINQDEDFKAAGINPSGNTINVQINQYTEALKSASDDELIALQTHLAEIAERNRRILDSGQPALGTEGTGQQVAP